MYKIAIIMAMHSEAEPVISKLSLKPIQVESIDFCKIPFESYYVNIENKLEVYLLVSGKCNQHNVDRVGTQAAAILSYITCEHIKPNLIISTGTAGADSKQGYEIGDVVIGEKYFFYYDRNIPLPGYEQLGLGFYSVYKNSKKIAKILGLKTAIIATGNSLINTERDSEILSKFHAGLKEMEVASIAEVASFYQIPVMAIKSITDYFDHHGKSPEQFLNNFNLATQKLSKVVFEVCKKLI